MRHLSFFGALASHFFRNLLDEVTKSVPGPGQKALRLSLALALWTKCSAAMAAVGLFTQAGCISTWRDICLHF